MMLNSGLIRGPLLGVHQSGVNSGSLGPKQGIGVNLVQAWVCAGPLRCDSTAFHAVTFLGLSAVEYVRQGSLSWL